MGSAHKISILSNNSLYEEAVTNALKTTGFVVTPHGEESLVLEIAIREKPSDISKTGCRFLITNSIPSNSDRYARVFIAPTRIGYIIDTMASYLQAKQQTSPVSLGQFDFTPAFNTLKNRHDNTKYQLTEKEAAIISFLAAQHPNPVERETLLHQVWGYADNAETHTVETHIYRLRQKIEKDPAKPDFLRTDDSGYFLNLT